MIEICLLLCLCQHEFHHCTDVGFTSRSHMLPQAYEEPMWNKQTDMVQEDLFEHEYIRTELFLDQHLRM